MAAEVEQLAAAGTEGVMEFSRVGRERIGGIQCQCMAGIERCDCQEGACITVPQTLQVRRARLA